MPDKQTLALRRQVARRSQIDRHRTRLNNEIHAVLAAPLIPSCPASDLFGRKGRVWLNQQPLPMDERLAVEQRLREIDRLGGEDLAAIDRLLCESVVQNEQLRRLLTITGVNCIVGGPCARRSLVPAHPWRRRRHRNRSGNGECES